MTTTNLTRMSFESTIVDNPIVLVDFWASWCGPCRAFAPVFDHSAQSHPDVVHAKVDTEAEQGLAAILGIRSIPTIMAFRDGVLVYSQPGAMPPAALEGIAEASPGRIIELLIMWRISNYRKVTEGLGLPESLSDFVDNNFTLGLPVSSHAREAALACWGRLREHALRRMHEAEQAGQ